MAFWRPTPWWKCPVCGADTEASGDNEDSEDRCTGGCGYRGSHSYGMHEEVIGEDVIGWTWNETAEEQENRRHLRQDLLNKARAAWEAKKRG